MSFQFKKIKPKKVEGDFQHEGQTLHIVVNADQLTDANIRKINALMVTDVSIVTGFETQTAQVTGMSAMLALLIESWDATDAKPEQKFFATLPAVFCTDLLKFVMELVGPKEKTAGA